MIGQAAVRGADEVAEPVLLPPERKGRAEQDEQQRSGLRCPFPLKLSPELPSERWPGRRQKPPSGTTSEKVADR